MRCRRRNLQGLGEVLVWVRGLGVHKHEFYFSLSSSEYRVQRPGLSGHLDVGFSATCSSKLHTTFSPKPTLTYMFRRHARHQRTETKLRDKEHEYITSPQLSYDVMNCKAPADKSRTPGSDRSATSTVTNVVQSTTAIGIWSKHGSTSRIS